MQTKKYLANSLKQAMDRAILELGSDAVLLGSTKVRQKGPSGLFRQPKYEVTFAYDPATVPSVKKKGGSGSGGGLFSDALGGNLGSPPGVTPGGAQGVASALANDKLEKRMDRFEATLTDFMNKFSIIKRDITYDYPEDIQALLGKMIDSQVREELAHSLAKQTESLMRSKPGTSAEEILEHLIKEQIGRPEPILHKKFSQKVILVLGPTGVGKTTTMMKLVSDFAAKQRLNVGIINTDTFRAAAQEQIQIYAEILEVPTKIVYFIDELDGAMKDMSDRDLIFVDSAGKRPGDRQHREELHEMVRILKPEDILLCLASTTSFASIKEMVDTYGFIGDYKLVITKLDETKYRGSILNISWYTHKPIAYITTGQPVPGNIEVVDVEQIAKEILK